MIYDVIIVGAGASGLFAGVNLDKKYKKLILEKTAKPGMKILLSGGERTNISNSDIDPARDYFTQNKKFLISIFSRYNNHNTINYFSENGISIIEEDRNRLILESGDSKELLNFLLENIKKNNCELKLNQDVKDIIKKEDGNYEIIVDTGEKYFAKNVIISSGGKSFSHIGTTGEGYNIAQKLGLKLVSPYRTLCGMSTKKDMSEISGASTDLNMVLIDNFNLSSLALDGLPFKKEVNIRKNKIVYKEFGPILFTHFGISGPIVHNLSNAIGEYLNSLGLDEKDFEKYILDNLSLDLTFDIEKTPKKLLKFFELKEDNLDVNIELQNWRSWKEAKATGGGVNTDELDNHMQSKKYKGLYFIGEVVDVTGKTGGFNLQWAWSSAYISALEINKNLKK